VVVEGDDFYSDIDWDERAGFSPGEAYARNYDWQRLRDQVLLPARNAASALRYQRYEWDNRQIGQWIEISMPEAVIVEGVYTLRPELREFFDLKVFVKASQNTRLDRMRARHQQYTEEIRSLHDAQIERWVAAENYYATGFEPQEHADIVISGESL
jgi:uridine kinase